MWCRVGLWLVAGTGVILNVAEAEANSDLAAVVCADQPSVTEQLAAREVRRYVYLRTGKLLPIVADLDAAPPGGVVLLTGALGVRLKELGLADQAGLQTAWKQPAGPDQYLLKTIECKSRTIIVAGGEGVTAPLYAAYRFAEHLGVRFYLHGDVVPDVRVAPTVPQLDELGQPLFEHRGIQPFHDFPEGPDWWDAEAYKAVLTQLSKLRMNFFGLHTYPEGGVGPEPLVWIGPPAELEDDGTVTASYPARHFTTANPTGAWGYAPLKTGDYSFGAAGLFDSDNFGPDYMRDTAPWTKLSPAQSNALFDRMGDLLADTFTFARQLGIKTCLGTETPLTIPAPLKQRLQAAGKNPADPAVLQDIYAGLFERIKRTHPLDYYWFWTPEGWTWSGTKQQDIDATLADLKAALAAAKQVDAPFTLATCGWVLGPQQDRALFDNFLPKTCPMSCISRQVGQAPIEPGFSNVKGRPKWSIPWMEDDPALISPQLWAGRMRKDAADSLAYGCTGLFGIHWRTQILGPNVAALAAAAWDQSGWNPALSGQPLPEQPKPPEGSDGGQFAAFPNNPIADTSEAAVYQDVRYDVDAYYLDVPNGKYTVTLKLCEPFYKEANRRVFGIKIQGQTLVDQIDLFAKVGQNRALDLTRNEVEVKDGRLVIDFVRIVEFPCVAAIVAAGPVTRKINCGGPAWKDYVADWAPAPANRQRNRFLPTGDFYADWAQAHFGPEVCQAIAEIFTNLDGHLPRPSDWVNGPGGIKPDPRPWEQVQKEYAFVEDLEALQPEVSGLGNRERFEYWLDTFRAMRASAQVNCTWQRFNEAWKKVKAETDVAAQQQLAHELALPIRKELVAQVGEVHLHLLNAVATYGELGNVTNWQQHLLPRLLTQPGLELAKVLGEDLPPDAMPWKDYAGRPRMFVPTIRTSLVADEPLVVKAVLLGVPAPDVSLNWRPFGRGPFARVRLVPVDRGVYAVRFPIPADVTELEYYVQANGAGGPPLRFPATAPDLNQTVVVMESP